MWSHERGLYKGNRNNDTHYWDESSGNADVRSIYKQVTFVRIDEKVYLRSGHLPDQPFVPLDYEKCAVSEEEFTPWTSEDNLLNWQSIDSPSMIGDDEGGYRWLRATQMHYLNNELWIIVPYLDTKDWSSGSIKRYVIEAYKREGHHFTRTQEIPLYKEDG